MTIYQALIAKAAERWRHAGCDRSSSHNFGTKHGALQQSPSCDLCWLEALARQVCADARRELLDGQYGCEIGEMMCKRAAALIGGPTS